VSIYPLSFRDIAKSENGRLPESENMCSHLDPFLVVVEPGGLVFEATDSRVLLEAARLAHVVLPSSCRNGSCRECMCRLVSGSIGYRIEWPGLTPEEKAENYILPCVAVAKSDLTIVAPRAKKIG
jgi:ferredoxin